MKITTQQLRKIIKEEIEKYNSFPSKEDIMLAVRKYAKGSGIPWNILDEFSDADIINGVLSDDISIAEGIFEVEKWLGVKWRISRSRDREKQHDI